MNQFKAQLSKINSWTILQLPVEVSKQLPSRGQVMVEGTINGLAFQSPLEPDGRGSHWFRITDEMSKGAKVDVGDTAKVSIEPTTHWPEPVLPADLKDAIASDSKVQPLWKDITPMARWDWIRWISGTKQEATRQRRIEVAFSKLKAGERRPCCFNRNMCMEPYVSKNGVLLGPMPEV